MNCNRKYFYYPENMNGLLLNIYYSLIICWECYYYNLRYEYSHQRMKDECECDRAVCSTLPSPDNKDKYFLSSLHHCPPTLG